MSASPSFPLLVGGRLRRAEPGRGHPVHGAGGALLGSAATATRADVGEAVAAARNALPGWSGTTAHHRGRMLLEVTELLDERRDRFAAEVAAVEGVRVEEATASVGAAADRWLWYAGWTDKITGLLGAVHPVAGPYVSWSAPRPIGVVGAAAEGTLLGLVDVLAPALAAGATAVVVTRHDGAVPVGLLAETLAVSPLPAGAVSLLSGDVGELAAALSSSVDGMDLAAAPPEFATAAHGIPVPPPGAADAGAARLRAWSTVTTVWHPIGR